MSSYVISTGSRLFDRKDLPDIENTSIISINKLFKRFPSD